MRWQTQRTSNSCDIRNGQKEEQRQPNVERVAIHSDGSRLQAWKTRVCFASNFEEVARTTFILPEDISRKSSQEGTGCSTVGFVFWNVPLLYSPATTLCWTAASAQMAKGSQRVSEHSFLLVSRILRLILPPQNDVTQIFSHEKWKKKKRLEYIVCSALK
jgi:hypothetical protein